MNPQVVTEAFAPLVGKPAYLVQKGLGSFVTMEFGEPSLYIREPAKGLPGRLVSVQGEWHLWIYCCSWRVTKEGTLVAHSESSDKEIEEAMRFLDGQCIESVYVHPDCSTTFEFDLGGVMETQPYEPGTDDEQWYLYEPGETVFSLRGDGTYDRSFGATPPDEIEWVPLWGGES